MVYRVYRVELIGFVGFKGLRVYRAYRVYRVYRVYGVCVYAITRLDSGAYRATGAYGLVFFQSPTSGIPSSLWTMSGFGVSSQKHSLFSASPHASRPPETTRSIRNLRPKPFEDRCRTSHPENPRLK